MLDQHLWLDPAQVETLAAAQDGHRHLADLGGGENEFGVRRRLFQRLQQGVEGLVRQHVHLVEHIDLVARLDGGVADAFDDVADAFDAGVAGGVHLNHIHVLAGHDGGVVPTLAGQHQRRPVDFVCLIIQGTGQQAGGGGLADAPHPGQHEGVGDAARGEGVGQGPDHGLLADQVLEGARPVFPRQHRIGLAVPFDRRGGLRRAGNLPWGNGDGCGRRRRSAEHVVGVGVALDNVAFGRVFLPWRAIETRVGVVHTSVLQREGRVAHPLAAS